LLCLGSVIYAQNRLAPPNDPNAVARPGQAEIIINAENSTKDVAVWINGIIAAHIRPKTREKIIVRNGLNIVEVADTTLSKGQWNFGNKKQINVDSNSNSVIIGMATRYGSLLSLAVQNTTPLGRGSVTPSGGLQSAEFDYIANAVYQAAEEIIETIPDGATLVVLSISSADEIQSELIMDELTNLLFRTRKFKLVDRKDLDVIRREIAFQYSGDVDDNSAVSLGKMLGASIVITGSVSGRSLRVKALDVETAELKAFAFETF